MTYKELAEKIKRMTEQESGTDVTIYINSEFLPLNRIQVISESSDVLDSFHPILVI